MGIPLYIKIEKVFGIITRMEWRLGILDTENTILMIWTTMSWIALFESEKRKTENTQITWVKSQLKKSKSKSKTVIDLVCSLSVCVFRKEIYCALNINYYKKSTIGQWLFGREVTYSFAVATVVVENLIFDTFRVKTNTSTIDFYFINNIDKNKTTRKISIHTV